MFTVASLRMEPSTRLVDVPRMVINVADRISTRLRAYLTRIYNMLQYKVPGRVKGNNIVKPIIVLIMEGGGVDIGPSHPRRTL